MKVNFRLNIGLIITTIFSLIIYIKNKIIPDDQNPFLINRPTISMKGQIINFNFKITSKLFNYNYIAVVFPVQLKFNIATNFTCSLYDPKNKININLVATNSLYQEEGNIAFCQVIDPRFPLIDHSITYQFSLNFTEINLSANYLNKIAIFTCSDNRKNRIIFDSNYFFGEIAAYNDYTLMSNPPLLITDLKSSVTPLTLFTTFDLTVTFEVKKFISQKSLILFKFPYPYISEPFSCYSINAADNNVMKTLLAGDIVCKMFGDSKDTLILTGLADDLPNTRSFKIVFRGFNSLNLRNTNTKTNNLFEAIVLYSNSYSVLSYSAKSIFNIDYINVSQFAIANSENQEIFTGGVWPIKITFTLDSSITSPSYVVIQQQNQSDLAKINFIASTCDFSQNNGLIKNNFGERPKCIPLSLDIKNFSKKGSGFFFRVNGLQTKKMYTITIFAYPENCGNFKYTTATLPNVSSVIFNFILTVFQDIKSFEFGEKRFFNYNSDGTISSSTLLNSNNNAIILAQSIKTDMANPCFNSVNLNNEILNQDPEYPYDVVGGSGTSYEKLLYNELHDFKLGIYRNVCDTDTDCYFYDLSNDKPFKEGYIYSKNKLTLLNNSYFALKSLIPYAKVMAGRVPYSRSMFAVNVIRPNLSTINKANAFGSTSMHYIFNKKYFQKGDNLCSIWWGYRHEFVNRSKMPVNFQPQSTPLSKQILMGRFEGVGMDPEFKNFITETGGSPSIDTTYDRFREPSIRISSKTYLTDIKVFQNSDEPECAQNESVLTCNILNFSLFSNCIKWADDIPPPLWQYAYLDITMKFRNQQSNIFSRVNRFFKFITNINAIDHNSYSAAPNLNIFNSFDIQKIKYFYSNFPGSNFDNAICLISISKDEILKIATEDSNMLKINIFGLTLFDSDYSKLAASYPISIGAPDYDFVISHNSADFLSDYNSKKTTGELFIEKDNYISTNQWADTYFSNLGPTLIFNNFSKDRLNSDLIIPTFCPNSNSFGLSIYWQTSYLTSFSGLVEKYNSIAFYKEPCGGTCERYKSFMANLNAKGPETYSNKGSIYFRPYSMNSDTNFDAYTMHFRNSNDQDVSCKAISILLNSEIQTYDQSNLDINTKIRLNKDKIALNTILLKANYDFYAFGRNFNKAIFVISDVDLIFKTQDTTNKDNLGNNFVTGIFRPTINSFLNDQNGTTLTTGKIAFSCMTDSASPGHLANVNRVYQINKSELNSLPSSTTLKLDFTVDDSSTWKTYNCTADPKYPNYLGDLGGSLICNIEMPIKLYQNSQFLIEFLGLNENSICSIKSKNLPTNLFNNNYCYPDLVGSQTSSNKLKCNILYPDNQFDIACYNINIINFEIPINGNTITLRDQDNTIILDNPYEQKFSITKTADDFNVIKTPSLNIPNNPINITDIIYTYSSQQNAFGKAFFSINFPRRILRNTFFTLYLDLNLSNFLIRSLQKSPECRVVNSGANINDSPEAILRTCEVFLVSNEDTSKSKIVFEFSSKNYFQGIDLGSYLQFTLFPVYTQFLNLNLPNNPIFYNFRYQYTSTKDDILVNTNSTSKILNFNNNYYFNEFSVQIQENTLCDITSAFPGVINEYNKITVLLDLQTNYYPIINNNTDKYPFNEVLFWLPSKNINFHDNFECSPKTNLILSKNLKCFIIPDNDLPSYIIIKIQFSPDVKLPQGLFEFYISGVKINTDANIGGFMPTGNNLNSNPRPNSFDFLCALNSYSQITGKRVTLINGFGKLRYSFNLPNIYGALNIDSVSSSNSMPRQQSSLTLKLNFEVLNKLTTMPSILDGYPFFVIIFPKELIIKYTKALKIGCSLADLNGNDSQQSLSVINTPIKSCDWIASNMVFLQLNNSIKNFTGTNFRFFQITFNNTYNVAEDTISTGLFEVYLSSENKNFVYKSYQNLNYQATQKLTFSNSLNYNFFNNIISYYRGMKFSFDPNLWIIDAYNWESDVSKDPNNFGLRNKLRIKVGRFSLITLRVRANKIIPNAQTNFTFLQEKIFSFFDANKQFSTAFNSLDVYIGTSCTTIPGSYSTSIYLSNTINFYPVIPLDITVEFAYANNIKMILPKSSVIKGSTLKIPVFLLEPNFDQLEIKFYNEKLTDPLSKINPVTFNSFSNYQETSFQSSFNSANGDCTFIVQVFNYCFNVFPEFKKFVIKITSNNSVLDPSFKLENSLKFNNFKSDTISLQNSLRFIFTPPVSYGFISCISVCYNSVFPQDSVLLTYNFQTGILNDDKTIASAFSNTFTNSNLDAQYLSFDNLIRGERYKIKCLFQFTSAENTYTRISEFNKMIPSLNSLNDNNNNNSTNTVFIETIKNTPTQCIQFYFNKQIDLSAQLALIEYCQILFKDASGCHVCLDSYGNINESVTLNNIRICGNKGESRLPFKKTNLDIDPKDSPTKTPLYYSRDYIGKYSTEQNLVNKYISVGDKKIPFYIPDTAPYLLCVVQDKTCSTNLDSNIFNNFINKLNSDLNNDDKIKQITGIPDLGYLNSFIISDSKPFINDISDFLISNPSINTNGYIYMQAYYKIPLLCHWKIQLNLNPAPQQYDIEKCYDEKLCGSIKLNMIPINMVLTNFINVDLNAIYNVYIACYNDLPYPTNISDLILLAQIKNLQDAFKYDDIVPIVNNNTNLNSTDTNSTNVNSTNTNNTSISGNKTI